MFFSLLLIARYYSFFFTSVFHFDILTGWVYILWPIKYVLSHCDYEEKGWWQGDMIEVLTISGAVAAMGEAIQIWCSSQVL